MNSGKSINAKFSLVIEKTSKLLFDVYFHSLKILKKKLERKFEAFWCRETDVLTLREL